MTVFRLKCSLADSEFAEEEDRRMSAGGMSSGQSSAGSGSGMAAGTVAGTGNALGPLVECPEANDPDSDSNVSISKGGS